MSLRVVMALGVVVVAGCWDEEPPIDECVCDASYSPVCGVDNITYGNACEAGCAGVEIAHEGECGVTGCRSDAECGMGQYCRFECAWYETDHAPYSDAGSADGGSGIAYPCDVGICEDLTPPPPSCTNDYECGPGFVCQLDPYCACNEVCDGIALERCYEDPTGCCCVGYADGQEGAPRDRAPEARPFIDPYPSCGYCVPAPDPACYSDADCAPSDYCDLSCDGGVPRALPAEEGGASDPPSGGLVYPHAGVCRPRPILTCDTVLCEAGTHCEEVCETIDCKMGWCEPVCYPTCVPDADPYCEDDSWCAPDQTCGNLVCEDLCWSVPEGSGRDGGCAPWCHGQCLPRYDLPVPCTSDDECLASGDGQFCRFDCPPCRPGPGEVCTGAACLGVCAYYDEFLR